MSSPTICLFRTTSDGVVYKTYRVDAGNVLQLEHGRATGTRGHAAKHYTAISPSSENYAHDEKLEACTKTKHGGAGP